MKCEFIYKNKRKDIIPINIILQQSIHQYTQLYVICDIYTELPEKIIIIDLFTGMYIFYKKLDSHQIAIYFCNENIKINSNQFLYLDSFTNQINNNTTVKLFAENFTIYTLNHIRKKHRPKHLEITHQYITDDDKTHKDIISHEFTDGIGYRKMQFTSIDIQYIKTLIEYICISCEYIELQCKLQYQNVRIGQLIVLNNKTYRILYIYHNFQERITTIRCHQYIEDISFHFCDKIQIKETIHEIDSIEIITPEYTENHYSVTITPNI